MVISVSIGSSPVAGPCCILSTQRAAMQTAAPLPNPHASATASDTPQQACLAPRPTSPNSQASAASPPLSGTAMTVTADMSDVSTLQTVVPCFCRLHVDAVWMFWPQSSRTCFRMRTCMYVSSCLACVSLSCMYLLGRRKDFKCCGCSVGCRTAGVVEVDNDCAFCEANKHQRLFSTCVQCPLICIVLLTSSYSLSSLKGFKYL